MAGSARPTIRASRSPTTSTPRAWRRRVLENDDHQQPAADSKLQDLRSRGHETASRGWQIGAVVLDHLARRPDSVRRLGLRARQRYSVDLVSHPVPHESQPGLQHGQ
jgi:hypothetical protein